MNEQEVRRIFDETGVLRRGHFVYTSCLHGEFYIDKDMIYIHPVIISRLCSVIAEQFADDGVEVVVGPEKGGIILSQWVGYYCSLITNREVLAFYAEKKDGGFIIKRGGAKDIICGKRILVVEDVLTTGGSARKVTEVVRAMGGKVVGLGALCNRGGIRPQDVADVPKLTALMNIRLETWEEAACPLCGRGVPINTDIGKGLEFMERGWI